MCPLTYLTTGLAVLVLFVSVQQFLLARENFKLGLFEKRFAIFKAIEAFINSAIANREATTESLQRFYQDTQTAIFLFNNDIVKFILDVGTKANQLTVNRREKFELPPGDERLKAGQPGRQILEELIIMQASLKSRFLPYLKFKRRKFGFLWELPD